MMADSTTPQIQAITDDYALEWQDRPALMKLAAVVNRVLPRGKGAIPRWIGRTFGTKWRTTITTDSGCRLAVDPANLDLFVTIQNEGAWEPWVRKACIRLMRQGGVLYDVGANAGTISNEVGRACGEADIYAFEPQLELARLTCVSTRLNELTNVKVYPVAVGDHCGSIQLHKPAHALHASTESSGSGSEQVVEVPLVSLDALVNSGQLPAPNLIKIDVEGGELNVLKGATATISKHNPFILFEANDNCERFGYSRDDLFEIIQKHGDYRFFKVAPGDTLASPKAQAADLSDAYDEIK